MFALPISKPRFKSIIFYQNSPKIKLFLQKNAKFLSSGGGAPRPPKQPPPPLRISGYAPGVEEASVLKHITGGGLGAETPAAGQFL